MSFKSSSSSSSSSSSGGTPAATGTDAPMVGYRFHPTDRELIVHYLEPKIRGQENHKHVIASVEVCKFEPWDLPVVSNIKSNDRVWYFFSPRQHKFGKSARSNRTTKEGFWKPDGKVRLIRAKGTKEEIGSKRTLVFHLGRYKKRTRTKWVMHEYECTPNPGLSSQGDFVLCKLKNKSDDKDTRRDTYHPTALNPEIEGSGSYYENQDLRNIKSVGELVDTNSIESSPIVNSNVESLSGTNYLQTPSPLSSQTVQTSNIHTFDSLQAINTSPSHYQNSNITIITSFDPETQANAYFKTYSNVLLGSCHGDASDGYSPISPSESAILSGTTFDSVPDICETDNFLVSNFENENLDDHDCISPASADVE